MSEKKKKPTKGKQITGGEPKKGAEKRKQRREDYLADAKDNKRGNIGPSGQGEHRGRERRNRQSTASERPDVSSIGESA